MAPRTVVPSVLSVVSVLSAQTPTPSPPPVKLSGYMQARETWQQDVGLTGSINRARLAASGTVAPSVTYRVQGEFRTGSVGTGRASVSLQDAYIRFTRERWAIQAGQFKTPFTREFITSLADLETADRSTAVDSLAPKRDIGLMGEYTIVKAVTAYAGVFNGDGQNVTAFADSTRYGADANYEEERVVVRGEYVAQSRDAAGGDDDRGWFVLGAFTPVPDVQLVAKYETFERPGLSDQQKSRAGTAGANLFPLGRATRLTVEYRSRKIGDPGIRKAQLLTQAQVKF